MLFNVYDKILNKCNSVRPTTHKPYLRKLLFTRHADNILGIGIVSMKLLNLLIIWKKIDFSFGLSLHQIH